MTSKEAEELLETYGLDRILEDNQITLSECLVILEEIGFLELDMYEERE